MIHLAITVALHFWLMRDLEKMAGASRIAIIYLGAGMIGNLASAIFVPYRAEVSCLAAKNTTSAVDLFLSLSRSGRRARTSACWRAAWWR